MDNELLDINSGSLVDHLRTFIDNRNEASKQTTIMRGQVTSVNPLTINVEDRLPLTEEFLVLLHTVKDYKVDITVSHTTENAAGGSGYAEYESHNHGYSGLKTIIVHNGLKVGEEVILLRQSGGQSFIVLDRANDPIVSGQWE